MLHSACYVLSRLKIFLRNEKCSIDSWRLKLIIASVAGSLTPSCTGAEVTASLADLQECQRIKIAPRSFSAWDRISCRDRNVRIRIVFFTYASLDGAISACGGRLPQMTALYHPAYPEIVSLWARRCEGKQSLKAIGKIRQFRYTGGLDDLERDFGKFIDERRFIDQNATSYYLGMSRFNNRITRTCVYLMDPRREGKLMRSSDIGSLVASCIGEG